MYARTTRGFGVTPVQGGHGSLQNYLLASERFSTDLNFWGNIPNLVALAGTLSGLPLSVFQQGAYGEDVWVTGDIFSNAVGFDFI